MSAPRRIRAARCLALTGPDAVAVQEVESLPPGPGEVRLRVGACGVNFPDLLMTRGLYQHRAEPPFIPGLEVAGTVLDVGEDVTDWAPGDRAVASVGAAGAGFAQETTMPADLLMPAPESLNDAEAACLYVGHHTGYNGVIERGRLAPGEVLVVTGAAGGVGLGAVQVGKAQGAMVIGIASTPEKRAAVLEAGADHALDPADPELREKVKALSGGEGADLVYDPVGGEMFDLGLRMLRPEGRLAVIGFASGDNRRKAAANYLLIKEIEVIGVRAGQYGRRHPERKRAAWAKIVEWAEAGRLRPRIWREYPLERAAEALKALDDRAVIGKVAVVMD